MWYCCSSQTSASFSHVAFPRTGSNLRIIFSESYLSVLYRRLYSPPAVDLLKSLHYRISLEAKGNGWPSVCSDNASRAFAHITASRKGDSSVFVGWPPFIAAWPAVQSGTPSWLGQGNAMWMRGQLLPRCSSALPSWQPWNSTWKMRSHLVTPQGKTTAGGGQCSKRSTPSFGIDIKSHGIFLEISGIFQASNFPSMLKRLPLFPIHLHHQNYCLLSFYLHHTLLLPLTPRGQLLRCHLSLFMKRAGMCMH